MKYSELVELRAVVMLRDGGLNFEEYIGNRSLPKQHVCWYICTNGRNDWWQCEQCNKYDPDRAPAGG